MKSNDAAEEFSRLFPDIYRRFHRRVHHTQYKLTSESLAVVQHLADTGPLTVMETAKHLDRSQPATSEMISRLIARGMLATMKDERDRRRTLIWLTKKGREALAEAREILSVELLNKAMGRLSATDRKRIIDITKKLLDTAVDVGGNG